MINTTKPTRIFPPTTKVPNVSTTVPASPLAKIERVVETFKPSRYNVNKSKREGKIENCKGFSMFMDVRRTSKARDILMIINMLSSHEGSGMISMATIKMTATITDKSLADMILPPSKIVTLFVFDDKHKLKFQPQP